MMSGGQEQLKKFKFFVGELLKKHDQYMINSIPLYIADIVF